jgi:hypothetical protein
MPQQIIPGEVSDSLVLGFHPFQLWDSGIGAGSGGPTARHGWYLKRQHVGEAFMEMTEKKQLLDSWLFERAELALGRVQNGLAQKECQDQPLGRIKNWRPVICHLDTGSQNGNSG